MSTEALQWAMRQLDLKAGPRWTLAWMADSASVEAGHSFMSNQTIARKTGFSRKSVIDHIAELVHEGYLVPGDDSVIKHYAGNRRPNVWRLNLTRGTGADLRHQVPLDPQSWGEEPAPLAGVTVLHPRSPRGEEPSTPGVKNLHPNQELNQEHPTPVPAQGDPVARERQRDALDPDRAAAAREACRQTVRQAIDQQKASQPDAQIPARNSH